MDLGDYFHLDLEARKIVTAEAEARKARSKPQMALWRCPGCGMEVRALGAEVAHRCQNRRNRMTNLERVGDSAVSG